MFRDFDPKVLKNDSFKEDAVREDFVLPVLERLGFSSSAKDGLRLHRSLKLNSPVFQVGTKSRSIATFPDYVLSREGKGEQRQILLVLDAKSPSEKNIHSGKHVEQVYSYAFHSEVRADKFALCNGWEWTFFEMSNPTKVALNIRTEELAERWEELKTFVMGDSEDGKGSVGQERIPKPDEWYLARKLPRVIERPRKQGTRRHFGVHGYFTKQSWDIVERYINHFTDRGDVVFDPYGGSGITIVEALMRGRRGIHIDLNPLSVFWVRTLLSKVNGGVLREEGQRIIKSFERQVGKTTLADVREVLPKNLRILSRGADRERLHDIFSEGQLLQLGLLKKLILKRRNKMLRDNLLLALSSTVTKINLTYHNSSARTPNAGDSGVLRYYRYRIAPNSVELDAGEVFLRKVENLVLAKKELLAVEESDLLASTVAKGDAADLRQIEAESVDYIYTDPPYGSKIEYLDLSLMWNAWLDLEVVDDDYEKEAIEGGHLNKTREDYSERIKQSLREMFRVLKWNRWMSFVFQHRDPYYWHLIVESAKKIGFEYRGMAKQDNGQTSFKKRKNPFSVLSGQLIINFVKKRNPVAMAKMDLGEDISGHLLNSIESTIMRNGGATIEQIYNALIPQALELGFLGKLKKYGDLTSFLKENFDYDQEGETYMVPKGRSIGDFIPENEKIRYYVTSYLRGKNRQGIFPSFDDVVLDVMPDLKNGTTPDDQTIRGVLEAIARRHGDGYALGDDDNLPGL